MNEIVRLARSSGDSVSEKSVLSQSEIEQAFRGILRWIGEDPDQRRSSRNPRRGSFVLIGNTFAATSKIQSNPAENL